MHGFNIPTERIDRARAMRAVGASWGRIVASTGVSMFVLKCEIIPGYREKERLKSIKLRTGRREGMPTRQRRLVASYQPIGPVGHRTEPNIIPFEILIERDAALRSPLTISQLLLGDPLPGRSALDKKRKSEIELIFG